MLKPLTSFWNKEYKSKSYGKALVFRLKEFDSILTKTAKTFGINSKEKLGIFYSDDCFVIFRNLGFLSNPLFVRALGPRSADLFLMGRLWRLWLISWSLSSRWDKPGIVLDLGTYNGKAMFTACKYAALKKPEQKLHDKIVIVADFFEDPPKEARKTDHGKNLETEVKKLFRHLPKAKVVKGEIPSSLENFDWSCGISWCQIDLNSAQADLSAFQFIYEKLLPGSHVIFDDYGFSRYKDTQVALDDFLSTKPESICELPTGQGLFIKS